MDAPGDCGAAVYCLAGKDQESVAPQFHLLCLNELSWKRPDGKGNAYARSEQGGPGACRVHRNLGTELDRIGQDRHDSITLDHEV